MDSTINEISSRREEKQNKAHQTKQNKARLHNKAEQISHYSQSTQRKHTAKAHSESTQRKHTAKAHSESTQPSQKKVIINIRIIL